MNDRKAELAELAQKCGFDISENKSDRKILRRVPEFFNNMVSSEYRQFNFAIIDIETLGLDPTTHPIIEIGVLTGTFTNEEGIIQISDTYESLNDPLQPIPEEITRITGITNSMTDGQSIDWTQVLEVLHKCDIVICHNSKFERKFLEIQAPDFVQERIRELLFGCTMEDINWKARGFESTKLKFLNYDIGYFYDAHRALTDCWATLNVLINVEGALDELKANVKKTEIVVCAVGNVFSKKETLKEHKYRFSNGLDNLPKCWWKPITSEDLENEINFLEDEIYCRDDIAETLPCFVVPPKIKHSPRIQSKLMHPTYMDNRWILREAESNFAC